MRRKMRVRSAGAERRQRGTAGRKGTRDMGESVVMNDARLRCLLVLCGACVRDDVPLDIVDVVV